VATFLHALSPPAASRTAGSLETRPFSRVLSRLVSRLGRIPMSAVTLRNTVRDGSLRVHYSPRRSRLFVPIQTGTVHNTDRLKTANKLPRFHPLAKANGLAIPSEATSANVYDVCPSSRGRSSSRSRRIFRCLPPPPPLYTRPTK